MEPLASQVIVRLLLAQILSTRCLPGFTGGGAEFFDRCVVLGSKAVNNAFTGIRCESTDDQSDLGYYFSSGSRGNILMATNVLTPHDQYYFEDAAAMANNTIL